MVAIEVVVEVMVGAVVMGMVEPIVEVIRVQMGVGVARGCNVAGWYFAREGIRCQRLAGRCVLGRL